jgi:DNA-binding transcriptional regulator YdaS (Cro superfamily)
MKSVKYLEQLRETLGNKSDAELARRLNVSKASISHYLTGRRVMDQETCLAVAMALKMNEHEMLQLLMAAGLDRAEQQGQQSLWSVFSERMAATAACALLFGAVTIFLTPGDAEATPVQAAMHTENVDQFILCQMVS